MDLPPTAATRAGTMWLQLPLPTLDQLGQIVHLLKNDTTASTATGSVANGLPVTVGVVNNIGTMTVQSAGEKRKRKMGEDKEAASATAVVDDTSATTKKARQRKKQKSNVDESLQFEDKMVALDEDTMVVNPAASTKARACPPKAPRKKSPPKKKNGESATTGPSSSVDDSAAHTNAHVTAKAAVVVPVKDDDNDAAEIETAVASICTDDALPATSSIKIECEEYMPSLSPSCFEVDTFQQLQF